jgi:hypothetical protein
VHKYCLWLLLQSNRPAVTLAYPPCAQGLWFRVLVQGHSPVFTLAYPQHARHGYALFMWHVLSYKLSLNKTWNVPNYDIQRWHEGPKGGLWMWPSKYILQFLPTLTHPNNWDYNTNNYKMSVQHIAHLPQECQNSKFWHFWVTGIERNVCRFTFNRYSVITQLAKLAAGEQLCRRYTHRKLQHFLKVSPEKSHISSCDTVVANERYNLVSKAFFDLKEWTHIVGAACQWYCTYNIQCGRWRT